MSELEQPDFATVESEVSAMKSAASTRQRILLILSCAAYVFVLQWIYINWLYPVFAYFGFDYIAPPHGYLVLGWILAVVPAAWMPLKLTRPSQLAYWVLYLTVLIPSLFFPLFARLDSLPDIGMLMITMFAGFAITGASYLLPLIPLRETHVSSKTFWTAVGILFLVLVAWVFAVFGRNMSFLSFYDVYDLRSDAEDLLEGRNVNYALMLLSGAINPLLMAWGLFSRRYLFVAAGIFGQLLIYSSMGTKGSLLSIVFIFSFYLLSRPGRIPFGLKLVGSVVIMLSALSMFNYLISGQNLDADGNPFLFMLFSVIFMRTFCINGVLTGQYFDFFSNNPETHYSHIKGVNWFVHYPYANTPGIEVGSFYSGDPTLDSTAHFWAADGLAAWGLAGVLLISVLCALVFWLLDSAAQRQNPRLATLVVCYVAFNLSNISIFTSLLSGGLGLLILLLHLMPTSPPEPLEQPIESSAELTPALQP
jgi:hypothetical protein